MSRSLADVKAGLPAAVRERVDARVSEIVTEIEGLQPMRIALQQTQDVLAKRLRVSQASVAKMEQRSDLLPSTLHQYVEALGGQLNLVVSFAGKPDIRISGLGDIPTARELARLKEPTAYTQAGFPGAAYAGTAPPARFKAGLCGLPV